MQRARLQMAKAFNGADHTDATHPSGLCQQAAAALPRRCLQPVRQEQEATGGRNLRYRGVSYGVY